MPTPLPLTPHAIGIDYTAAYEQGAGIGRLVRDLIQTLAETDTQTTYKLFVAGAIRPKLPRALGQNFQWKPTRVTPLWFARLWYRARLYWPIQAFIGHVALYHATDFTLPPTLPNTKTILTVHDLSYVRTPETTHPILKAYLDNVVPWSVKRATHIIADSQATKDDLIELYKTPADKISVLLSGVNPIYRPITDPATRQTVRERYNIPLDKPYIFSIGTVQPRKNYARLIEALAALGKPFEHIQIVIAGGKGWLDNPIFATVQALDMQDRVHFTGYVNDADVPILYSDALCTSYISLYEGFGFPVLESMACGTPVITSNTSSLPEVAGNAAPMVNPYNVEEISAQLRQIIEDSGLRTKLIQAGFTQVQNFTWQKSAQKLLSIYHDVLNS